MNLDTRTSLLLVLAAAASWSGSALPAAAQVPDLPGWQLVWQDEFDGDGVDTDNWEVLTRQNSFNNEKQYYVPEQATVVDGKLRITATNQPLANKAYRSARLESWQAFGPGRFEARIDLPTTQGMWPAFWLFPNSPSIPWPTGGEIDIMENRGSQPTIVSSAYHWPGPGQCGASNCRFQSYATLDGEGSVVNFHNGFHVYAVEWDETQLRFYVDGHLHFVLNESGNLPIFETPKNIILNLAVGGIYDGDPDGTTVFPQVMEVDYVRVWQRQVPLPGDYNGDGQVDAGDYVRWRNHLGEANEANINNNGDGGGVEMSDYGHWKAHYGNPGSGSGGLTLAVPEPTTWLLVAFAALVRLCTRRRTHELEYNRS